MSTSNKKVGIDISDSTIEIAEVEKIGTEVNILSLGRIKLEAGTVERGRVRNKEKLKTAIKKVFAEAKPRTIPPDSCIFGLPEALMYTHVFSVDISGGGLEEAVLKELEITIPLKRSGLLYSYKILDNNFPAKNKTRLLLTAFDKRAVLEWQNFFKAAEVNIKHFDIETIALFRAMYNKYPDKPICLIDIGAMTTKVSVFTLLGLTYSFLIDLAGRKISLALAGELNISFNEAEDLKISSGLKQNEKYPKADVIIKRNFDNIFKKVKANIDYFDKRYNYPPIKEIIMVGGTSKIAGFADYLSTLNIGLGIRIGKSLHRQEDADIEYTEAIGLALRGFNEKWSKIDPFVPIAANKEKKINSLDFAGTLNSMKKRFNYKIAAAALIAFVVFIGIIYLSNGQKTKNRKIEIPAAPPIEKNIQKPESGKAKEEKPKEEAAEPEQVKKVVIKNIEGSLNVRFGPGAEFKVISTVKSGEEYILIEEAEEWVKIKITDILDGWVFKAFTGYAE